MSDFLVLLYGNRVDQKPSSAVWNQNSSSNVTGMVSFCLAPLFVVRVLQFIFFVLLPVIFTIVFPVWQVSVKLVSLMLSPGLSKVVGLSSLVKKQTTAKPPSKP